MSPELRQFIEHSRFHQAAVQELAGRLPAEDAELDGLIAEVVGENDQKAFMFLVVAALSRQRPVDARHLARGAMMFPYDQWLCGAAWQMQGDVPEHLLDAINNTRLNPHIEAAALFVAAAWCQERRNGVLPAGLITTARLLARRQRLDVEVLGFLLALAMRTNDAGLNAVLRQRYPDVADEKWKSIEEDARRLGDHALEKWREPILELAGEKPSNELASGTTMRRAVPRHGRNEPCPCGSGKKYKHCCLEKDQERLHHSSEVAGRTQEELHAEPEPHLTAARLEKTEVHEMARLDPAKIPRALLPAYFLRLSFFNLFDRAAAGFEKLGFAEDLAEAWGLVMFWATRAGRKDTAERLMKVRAPTGFTEDQLDLGDRLLLAEGDPARCLELLDAGARKALETDDTEELLGFVYGVTISKYRALGILFYRGAFPLVTPKKAAQGFEQLLQARDRLNLPPDDPFSDIIDKRFADDAPDASKDAAELRKAQRSLDAKAQEVRQLKESLERLEKEIARREKPAAPAAPTAPATPADDRALKELREKVEGLKSALKERHNERNMLRRELQKAHTDLEALRQKAAPPAASAEAGNGADHEEDLLLPQETEGNQPIRLIEFPRNFPQTLASVPRHVARGALAMLGRMAGGEAAAFVGAVRLKACPAITRQRIGIDHRLLFRLLPDRVQVVDLIPRQDLERKIKTLV